MLITTFTFFCHIHLKFDTSPVTSLLFERCSLPIKHLSSVPAWNTDPCWLSFSPNSRSKSCPSLSLSDDKAVSDTFPPGCYIILSLWKSDECFSRPIRQRPAPGSPVATAASHIHHITPISSYLLLFGHFHVVLFLHMELTSGPSVSNTFSDFAQAKILNCFGLGRGLSEIGPKYSSSVGCHPSWS